jgi:IS5 family transposase
MLRIHCLQQWYGLSDPAMEEELYEIASMRQFAGLSLARGTVPDETTILNFRHLLEQHGLRFVDDSRSTVRIRWEPPCWWIEGMRSEHVK